MRRSDLLFQDTVDKPWYPPTPRFRAFLDDVGIPGGDLAEVDKALQERFFQRKPGTNEPVERWELNSIEVQRPPARFWRHLNLCGFGLATIPQRWQYTYAVWPGALLVRAAARLQDLISAWKSGVEWQTTVVLGGKRPLQANTETPVQALSFLGKTRGSEGAFFWEIGIQDEIGMMRWLWNEADMPSDMRETVRFVDAPMKPPATPGGQPVRPNTEDTIRHWLTMSRPVPADVLLSSGAPYGMAQDEALWKHLGPLGFIVETFGHAAPDLPPEVFMREVAGTVHQIHLVRGLAAH